jgi:predicted RNA-binding protein with TRAM domain
MEISDDLLCLFSAEVEEQHDSYTIEIPKREITTGDLQPGKVYRTAILATRSEDDDGKDSTPSETEGDEPDRGREQNPSEPPVGEGDVREVDIEDIGEKGDGITRVERGFVVIVPETEQGERVTVEITDVQPNVAFAEVKERQTHF